MIGSFLYGKDYKYDIHYPDIKTPTQEVYSILQDKNGYIWCSSSRGITRFDGSTSITLGVKDGLNDPTVFQITEQDDRIWFQCYNGDVGYVKDMQVFIVKNYPVIDNVISWIKPIGDNLLITFCGTSISGYDILTETGEIIESKSTDEIGIYIEQLDSNTRVIYGYTTGAKSAFFVDGEAIPTSKKIQYMCKKTLIETPNAFYGVGHHNLVKITPDTVTNIYEKIRFTPAQLIEKNGDVWVGTENGIIILKNGSLTDTVKILEGHAVGSLERDHEGNIWVATLNNGVFFIRESKLNQLTPGKISNIKLIDDSVYVVHDKYNLSILHHKTSKGRTIKSPYFLWDFVPLKGELYFSYAGFPPVGKIHLDKLTSVHRISGYLFDYSEDVRIGVSHIGIVYITEDTVILSKHKQKDNLMQTVKAVCLIDEKKGYFTTIKGIYEFHMNKDAKTSRTQHINGYPLRTITFKKNKFWGTIKGLGIVSFDTNWTPLDTISAQHGLSGNFIDHLLWINDTLVAGSSAGLNFIHNIEDEEQRKIHHFKRINGLLSNEITSLSFVNRKLLIGSDKGLQSIDLEDVYNSAKTDWILNIEKINDLVISSDNPTQLPAGTRSIDLKFNAISYSENETPFVQYRIKQLDSKWRETQSNRVQYVNTDPGVYDFEIRMGDQYKSTQIVIAAAFYETMWFWLLVTVLFLYAVSYVFLNYIHQKELRLQQNLDKIQLQQIVLTTRLNPHFIFNSLSSLQTLIIQKRTMQSVQFLSSFSNLMRQLLDRSGESFTLLSQEQKFISRYIEVENTRFAMNILAYWDIQEGIDIHHLKIPSMLLQPLVENCIQHGFRNYRKDGIITISVTIKSEGCLELIIRDNGRGLPEDATRRKGGSTSTVLIKERIALMGNIYHKNYSYTIHNVSEDNKEETGTQITMLVPYERQ